MRGSKISAKQEIVKLCSRLERLAARTPLPEAITMPDSEGGPRDVSQAEQRQSSQLTKHEAQLDEA